MSYHVAAELPLIHNERTMQCRPMKCHFEIFPNQNLPISKNTFQLFVAVSLLSMLFYALFPLVNGWTIEVTNYFCKEKKAK